MPEAKAKIRARHQRSIDKYLDWLRSHALSTWDEKIEMFDFLVDHPEYEISLEKRRAAKS